jgi:hypothetical protein
VCTMLEQKAHQAYVYVCVCVCVYGVERGMAVWQYGSMGVWQYGFRRNVGLIDSSTIENVGLIDRA